MQLRPVGQHDRIAFQLDTYLSGKLDNKALKLMRLSAGGGEKYLITAGFQCVNQGFAGEIPGRPNLARLEDIPDSNRQTFGFEPALLMLIKPIVKLGS
ncbi:Uncharacterised protein [Yersinia enterocolitica]|nr:Uncharacterised protein [Yersinia enterocolitica]